MANATNYLENRLVDHLFRAATLAKPTALYVALFTAAPSDAGGGTEVTGGNYARVNVAPADLNWSATQGGTSGASSGTAGATGNAAVIAFANPSAAWGSVTHFAIFDAATAGNMLLWGALSVARVVNNGDPGPRFLAGQLTVTVA